ACDATLGVLATRLLNSRVGVPLRAAASPPPPGGRLGGGRSPPSRHWPATGIREIITVGAAVWSREVRSRPIRAMFRYMSSRLPAPVISSTGYVSLPPSIQ